jgi:hypothetical protein
MAAATAALYFAIIAEQRQEAAERIVNTEDYYLDQPLYDFCRDGVAWTCPKRKDALNYAAMMYQAQDLENYAAYAVIDPCRDRKKWHYGDPFTLMFRCEPSFKITLREWIAQIKGKLEEANANLVCNVMYHSNHQMRYAFIMVLIQDKNQRYWEMVEGVLMPRDDVQRCVLRIVWEYYFDLIPISTRRSTRSKARALP